MGTYIITGGTGFIGSYIARDLIREGDLVILYDSSPNRNERSLKAALSEVEQGKPIIIKGDVLDLEHLMRTIKEYGADVIIHMAYILARASSISPSLAIKVNCVGTNNIFEAIRLLGLKTKLVWASSCTVFGSPKKHKEEYLPNDAPHYPQDIYGASKSFIEHMAEYYFQQYGIDSIGLRFSPVYGAGMQEGITASLVRELIENAAIGKPGNVPFGDEVVNWLYVEDAARLLLLAAKVPKTETRVFSVSGDLRSVKDAADYVRKLIPDANLSLQPGYWGLCFKYDTSLLEKEIGFKPRFSMEEGIKEIVNTIRNQTKNKVG